MLHRHCTFFKNWRFAATLYWARLLVPFFSQLHLLTSHLWHILVIFAIFQNFNYFYICYGDLWSVSFDVTIVTVLGCHELHPCKSLNSMDKCYVCSDCSTGWQFSFVLPVLGPDYSLRHNNIETRPINNLRVGSKCSSERKSCQVSHFKSKTRND